MDRRRYEPEPAPHGVKRTADDSGLPEQRLTKRMGLLTLDKNAVAAAKAVSPRSRKIREVPDEYMAIENTKDRVFIHDLDAELSESEDERPIFLPDIERKFMKIPKSILAHPAVSDDADSDKTMVLYNVPTSLTVSQDKDSVRKAIIEARARAREQSVQNATIMNGASSEQAYPVNGTTGQSDTQSQDEMEIE